MSAGCSVCGKDIREPDSIWYAGTRFSWNVQWVCGTCLAMIPDSMRHSTGELQLHDISFGVLQAETNRYGVYQGMTSKQGPVIFWVTANDIEAVYPEGCACLASLYPYYRIERHLLWLARQIQLGAFEDPGEHARLVNSLLVIGRAAESYLLGRGPDELVRDVVTPYSLPDELTQEQWEQVAEMKGLIVGRYGVAGKVSDKS